MAIHGRAVLDLAMDCRVGPAGLVAMTRIILQTAMGPKADWLPPTFRRPKT